MKHWTRRPVSGASHHFGPGRKDPHIGHDYEHARAARDTTAVKEGLPQSAWIRSVSTGKLLLAPEFQSHQQQICPRALGAHSTATCHVILFESSLLGARPGAPRGPALQRLESRTRSTKNECRCFSGCSSAAALTGAGTLAPQPLRNLPGAASSAGRGTCCRFSSRQARVSKSPLRLVGDESPVGCGSAWATFGDDTKSHNLQCIMFAG